MKIGILMLLAAPLFCQTFDSASVTTIMVPMRDGVKLATDVYRPASQGVAIDGKFPVLVTRSPYNKNGERKRAEQFAQHGYVFVAQDVRGRYASQGHLNPLLQEGTDGFDTIVWAAEQPWSNGKVGTVGASYLAMDQFSAAALRPPGLVAMYAAVGSADYYHDAAYNGGVQSTGWPVWIAFSASTSQYASEHKDIGECLSAIIKDPSAWLRQTPEQRMRIFSEFPDQRKSYEEYLAHPHFDAYWQQVGYYPAARFAGMPDVPMMFVTGWYDQFVEGTLDIFTALSRMQKTAKHLIIGPWPHGYGQSKCGVAQFGPDAELHEFELQLQWFDRWMRGATVGNAMPAIKYYRMGGAEPAAHAGFAPGGQWLTAGQWPPNGATKKTFFLAAGALLSDSTPEQSSPVSYRYDPSNPAPTIGRSGPQCIQDQRTERSDIISFTSQPLQEPLNVTGSVKLNLWISSSAKDADFIAKLVDVYPDGFAMNLAEGRIRATARNGDKSSDPLTPGAVYSLTIDMGSTSNLFAPNHRIRLMITSSSFPQLEPNPNGGTESIYHDRKHPSSLDITIVPAGDRAITASSQ